MRFSGYIGFVEDSESKPGIHDPVATERPYKGYVTRRGYGWAPTDDTTNHNITFSNDIRIIADEFVKANLGAMRYIHWGNQYYSIDRIQFDTDNHGLTISLGGLYVGTTDIRQRKE